MSPIKLINFLIENDLEDLEDFDVKELMSPPRRGDRVICGQLCQICHKNACTLIHRRGDRDWENERHMCHDCDVARFNAMLDRM